MGQRDVWKLTLFVYIAVTNPSYGQQSNAPGSALPSFNALEVVHFEEMKYPAIAQYAPNESRGPVVLKVTIDEQGKVAQAFTMSGNPLLTPEALANIKKWQFSAAKANTGVIVYNFRRTLAECGSLNSLFIFEPPNLVTVSACIEATEDSIEPLGGWHGYYGQVIHSDLDIKYPPLARTARIQGLVVVQAEVDAKGKVVKANALTGHPLLSRACVENTKKWVFDPELVESPVVVYNFRLGDAEQTELMFEPPNFITITSAAVVIDTENSTSH
jgi:TonB family protein